MLKAFFFKHHIVKVERLENGHYHQDIGHFKVTCIVSPVSIQVKFDITRILVLPRLVMQVGTSSLSDFESKEFVTRTFLQLSVFKESEV